MRINYGGARRFEATRPIIRDTSDGKQVETRYVYPIYVDDWHYGLGREQVELWARWVLHHSQGWARAGLWIRFVKDPAKAKAVLRYVEGPFRCGSEPDAAGCTEKGEGKTLIRMGHHVFPDDSWQSWNYRCKGLLHEIAHDPLNAQHPGGDPSHFGVMGGHIVGDPRWPVPNDITSAQRFLAG